MMVSTYTYTWLKIQNTAIFISVRTSNFKIIMMSIYLYAYVRIFNKKVQRGPATCHGGTLCERRYSSYSFLTSALEGSEWSASCPSHTLPLGNEPPVPIVQEAGLAPEPVWMQRGSILCFCRGSNPGHPVHSQTLY
jgi:hypothetical protein